MTTATESKINCSFSFLFNIINEAKNVAAYEVANIAFAVLLDKALDVSGKEIKFIWESDFSDVEIEQHLTKPCHPVYGSYYFYDLCVISDGLREVCIPAPLLKHGVVKAFFKSRYKTISRRQHSRSIKPLLPKQKDYLLNKLLQQVPDAINIASKYLIEN